MLSRSGVSDSLRPHSLPGSSVCGDSPGKNTGVGCHAFLQEIFLTQRSNLGLPHCRWILYHLNHQGSPEEEISLIKRTQQGTGDRSPEVERRLKLNMNV